MTAKPWRKRKQLKMSKERVDAQSDQVAVRPALAVIARHLRRTLHPYQEIVDPRSELATAIGALETVAAGNYLPMGELPQSLRRALKGNEDVARRIREATAATSYTLGQLSGLIKAGPVEMNHDDPLDQWRLAALFRDIEIARQMGDLPWGPAVDPGGDGLFGEVWPWELSGYRDAQTLVAAHLNGHTSWLGGRLVAATSAIQKYHPDLEDIIFGWRGPGASSHEVLAAKEVTRFLGAVASVVIYIANPDPDEEAALTNAGVTVLSEDSFTAHWPRSESELVFRAGQVAAHGQLGLDANHSPADRPSLATSAVYALNGLEMPPREDWDYPIARSKTEADDILNRLVTEFQDNQAYGPPRANPSIGEEGPRPW